MIGHTEMANPIFSTISVEYSWGRWQPEMKKNSKLGHERGSKKGVENTTRNCGKRDQLRVVCHHLFSVTFRFPSKWKWKLYTSIKISKKKSSLNFCAKIHEFYFGFLARIELYIIIAARCRLQFTSDMLGLPFHCEKIVTR